MIGKLIPAGTGFVEGRFRALAVAQEAEEAAAEAKKAELADGQPEPETEAYIEE